jgi:acetoacetate decarboxylase
MPDSSGFGSYTESGMVIPCRLGSKEVNFVTQMYLDDDPPIAAGREIWGFPKKYAHPEIVKDTAAAGRPRSLTFMKARSSTWT